MIEAFRSQAPDIPVTVIDPQDNDTVMDRAVAACGDYAAAGDVVLMAPACASMDQFVSMPIEAIVLQPQPRHGARCMVSDNSSVRKSHGNANKPALVITDYTGWRSLLNPLWCYNGFRMAVVGLTCFGLIMVFSSSTVTMAAQGKSPFVQLLNQGVSASLA